LWIFYVVFQLPSPAAAVLLLVVMVYGFQHAAAKVLNLDQTEQGL
jgi:hypothetical protein